MENKKWIDKEMEDKIDRLITDIYEERNKESEREIIIWTTEVGMKAFDDAIKEQAKKYIDEAEKWRKLNV